LSEVVSIINVAVSVSSGTGKSKLAKFSVSSLPPAREGHSDLMEKRKVHTTLRFHRPGTIMQLPFPAQVFFTDALNGK
jgi:hypothetical protein